MINYSIHADEKMDLLDITASEVEMVLLEGKEIEIYDDAYPFPAVLLSHCINGKYIHVVVGLDIESDVRHIVTVYYPDPDRWCENFTRRK